MTTPAEHTCSDRPGRASAFSPGDRLGRYVLLEPLGEGGMGQVFSAHDVVLDRRVAIKVLLESRRHERARLVREAQAMARLCSPHVVSVHDVGELGGDVFVAMELVDGEDLRRWLRRDRSVDAIVRVFLRAGEGLHAAHAAGLVHRDFKPDNVLVSRDGRVLVTDFGLASPADHAPTERSAGGSGSGVLRLTETGCVMGTPVYMPIEQHRGEPTDPRSDQFSFCVALYEALYGVRPFVGDSPRELCAAIARGPVLPVAGRDVPRSVRDALVRGLAADPRLRFANMAALLRALKPRPRRRTTVALAGMLVAGVCGATGFGLGRASEPSAHRVGVHSAGLRDAVQQLVASHSAPLEPTSTVDCEAFASHLGARMLCLERFAARSVRRAAP